MRRRDIYLEVGNVAMNLDGDVGVVEQVVATCSRGHGCSQPLYIGHRLGDSTLLWQSISPVKLADNADDFKNGGAKRLKEARANLTIDAGTMEDDQ